MQKTTNLLFTSVGRRSYLVKYFKDALAGRGKIHVTNSSGTSPVFQVADYAAVTPLIYDSEYIPFLLDYCAKHSISAIISLFDIDLLILSKNKDKFAEIGTSVIVSDENVINICNDKWKTFEFLTANNFRTPKTFLTLERTFNALEKGFLHFPLIVKPRWGMGSIGVFEAETEEELKVFYKKVKRAIQNTYLKYEAAQDLKKSVLIQEKLNGQEYGIDVINDLHGNYQTSIIKMKNAMRSGETDCAITVQNDNLKTTSANLSKILQHIGNLDVDMFICQDQNYVLEMNARFGGGYPFSHMAGVNLPLAIIEWLRGENIERGLLTERINVMAQKDIKLVLL